MDEFDNNTTPYDETGDEQHAEGSSRRTFLKAAVIGSATAVAVSGVGAATLTLTGRHTGLTRFVTLGATVSGLTGHACTTDTPKDASLSEKGEAGDPPFKNQESIYFWFKVNNVPAGTYTLDVSPTIDASSVADYAHGSGSLVQYQSSNNVKVYEYAAGTSTFECHPTSLGVLPAASKTSNSLPITINPASAKDVVFEIHLQGEKNNPGGSVTLTATLYQGSSPSGTQEASASVTFTISA